MSADFLLVIEEHTVDYDMEVHGVGCDRIYEKGLLGQKGAFSPQGIKPTRVVREREEGVKVPCPLCYKLKINRGQGYWD